MEALEKLVFLAACLLLLVLFLSWMVPKLVEVNDYREQADQKEGESGNNYIENDLEFKFEDSKSIFKLLRNFEIFLTILSQISKYLVKFLDIINLFTLFKKETIIC